MILSAGIDKSWLHIIIVNHCVWAILLLLVKQSLNLLPLTNAWIQGWWNLIWFNNHCSQLSWDWWGWSHYWIGISISNSCVHWPPVFIKNVVHTKLCKFRLRSLTHATQGTRPPAPWSPAAPRNHSQRTQSTWNAQKSVLPRAPLFSPLWTW